MNKPLFSLVTLAFLCLLSSCIGWDDYYMKFPAPDNLLWVKNGGTKVQFESDERVCLSVYSSVYATFKKGDTIAPAQYAKEQCFLKMGYKFTNYFDKEYRPSCGGHSSHNNGPACKSIGK